MISDSKGGAWLPTSDGTPLGHQVGSEQQAARQATYSGGLALSFLTELKGHPVLGSAVPDMMKRVGARVPVDLAHERILGAVRLTGDEDMGLRAAKRGAFGNAATFDYLLSTANDVRSAVLAAGHFAPLINDILDVNVFTRGGDALVTLRLDGDVPRAVTDFLVAGLFTNHLGRWLSDELASVDVWLPYEEPRSILAHKRVFGPAALCFSAPSAGFVFAVELLDRKLRTADVELHQLFGRFAEEEIERDSFRPFTGRVRRLLAETNLLDANLGKAASELGLSTRTFSRKLMSEGTTFNEILDGSRRDAALRLIADRSISLDDLANTLGFGERGSFQRAFRRWTGVPPGQFRRRTH